MWAGAKLSILVPVQLTASIPPIKQSETLYRFIHTLTRSLTQHVMNNNHTDCCCHCVCVCSRVWSAWSMHLGGGAMTSSGWQAVRTVGVNQVRPDPLMVWTFIFKHFPVTCVRVTVQGADRLSSLVQMERQDVANPMWCAVRSWVVIWTFFFALRLLGTGTSGLNAPVNTWTASLRSQLPSRTWKSGPHVVKCFPNVFSICFCKWLLRRFYRPMSLPKPRVSHQKRKPVGKCAYQVLWSLYRLVGLLGLVVHQEWHF